MAQSLFGLTPEQIQQARQLQQQQAINQQAQSFGMFGPLYAASRGLSQTGINALAQGLFPEAQDPALRRATTTQAIVDKYKGQDINDPTILSSMAKEFSAAGLPEISLQLGEEASKRTKKMEVPDAKKQAEMAVFTINQIPESQRTEEQLRLLTAANLTLRNEEAGQKVQSTKILDDGTIVTVYNSGKKEVIDPEGKVVEGKAAADAIRRAAQFGVDIAGSKQAAQTIQRLSLEARYGPEIAGGKAAGEQAIKLGGEAFAQLNNVRTNIGNLKSAKDALARGANTGAIASRLPNITAASIELNNIRNRLGLDVVGSVTFGALSEGELGLALDTALPLTLPENDLKDYIIRKITAQEKLANYLDSQAKFLSKPGNTLNKWIETNQKRPEGSTAKNQEPSTSTATRKRYNPATGKVE